MKPGSTMSEESREKMRLAKVGYVPWNKGLHLPSPFEGKHHSAEAREKMRIKKLGNQNHKGKPHSEETIALIKKNRTVVVAWNKGIEMPESFCKTMSEVQRGKTIPSLQRKKISLSLTGREKTDEHTLKVMESNSREGFWYGHRYLINPPKLPQYCEIWKDVNPRVHAFFNYKCVECGAPETKYSHIGHHVFYVKQACCWFSDDGIYYTNLKAPDHPDEDYYIGENPNYFVILCSPCHGRTNGNFANRKKWADHFKELIDTKYNGKCYYTEKEFEKFKKEVRSTD
jgi:hypothetical protein